MMMFMKVVNYVHGAKMTEVRMHVSVAGSRTFECHLQRAREGEFLPA